MAKKNRSEAALKNLLRKAAQTDETLNLVLIYTDAETRAWAREMYEKIAALAGIDRVRPTWWKVSDLASPGVLAGAVSTTLRADLILVAAWPSEGLPLPFYVWVNSWTAHRPERLSGLIALLAQPEQKGPRSGRLAEYLRTVAGMLKLQYLHEDREMASQPPRARF